MNGFTKQELIHMADGIVLIKNSCRMNDKLREDLNSLDQKLCEMINNYKNECPAVHDVHCINACKLCGQHHE